MHSSQMTLGRTYIPVNMKIAVNLVMISGKSEANADSCKCYVVSVVEMLVVIPYSVLVVRSGYKRSVVV